MTSVRAAQTRWAVVGTVVVTIGEALTWLLLRSQGNDLGGDQAHYLIAGQTLSHFSLHPDALYRRDFATHFIYRWPPGATVANHTIVQTYPGPHGAVFAHGLGLPLLLAPFLAIGSVPLGLLAMFALTAFGFAFIHQRASLLADLSGRAQIVFALVLAAPALWLASTQVYPDLLGGVGLGMALVEIAWVERRSYLSRINVGVIAVTVALEPWLQVKNLAPALCCLIALVIISPRLRTQRLRLLTLVGLVALGWILLALYNQYYFSDLIGLPQPHPTISVTSLSRVVALVFDRHQGLLVQVPTVLLGLVGLGLARRHVPWTVLAALVGALAMLVINGTYTSGVPFGGTDFAGRFQWTVLPMLLLWAPYAIGAIDRSRRRILGVGLIVALLWLAQGIPILLGDHVDVNAMIAPFAPWDPTLYPGWWPFAGQYLPVLLAPGLRVASTWTHLLVEVLIAGAAAVVLVRLSRPEPVVRRIQLVAPLALVVAAVVVLAAGPTRTIPSAPLTWSGAAVGAPWTGTQQPATTPAVGLAEVGPGTYRLTIAYAALLGSTPATATLMATAPQHVLVSGWLTPHHPTDAALLTVTAPPVLAGTGALAHAPLAKGAHRTADITIHVSHQSLLSLYITVQPHTIVAASTLSLSKLSG